MLRLTVEDYYEIPEEKKEAFQMQEVKPISYKNDKRRLWFLNDEKKTLEYLQKDADPDTWLELQNKIENINFHIHSIFAWKKRSLSDKKFAKSSKEL